jgi:hypothetical protein
MNEFGKASRISVRSAEQGQTNPDQLSFNKNIPRDNPALIYAN